MEKFPITSFGYEKMKAELHHLMSVERPAIVNAIAEARSHGDLSENAEYSSAKEKQGMIEARIADFNSKVLHAEVIDTKGIKTDMVQFGATISLIDTDKDESFIYRIVSDYEANSANGNISIFSPVAQAALGKRAGDELEVSTPRGLKYYELLAVSYE